MKFSRLADYFAKIESTTSRLEITHLLAAVFQELNPDELRKTIYLLQGRVAPSFIKIEFGMAEKTVLKSIIQALSLERRLFEKQYQKIGDLGKTVEYFKKQIISFDQEDLSLEEVFLRLYQLATASGLGSQEKKINVLINLIRQLDPLSCRFLVRIPLGVMRLGFSDMTLIDAFSWMLEGNKSLRPEIEKAYHVRPDLGMIGYLLKKNGLVGIKKIEPEVFTPIIMMRAERLSSAQEIIEKIGRCAIEPKYDGFRLQIHYSKKTDEVKIYSRNLEEVSFMYPDIVNGVKKEIVEKDIIFEGEAIGFDPLSSCFSPFQATVQRKRKYEIIAKSQEIPLKLFVFELLYKNGVSYINQHFLVRRKELKKSFRLKNDLFQDTLVLAPEEIVADSTKIDLLFNQAVEKGLEGIIAKKLDGIYQPGARGWNWIKFKRSYSAKVNDTLDCLVMGYDYGKGKRVGFGIGAFLVGVYDKKTDSYKTVAKIGTGLTDHEWKKLQESCGLIKTKTKPQTYDVDKQMQVDVWVAPKIVVEIRADEITRSPVHTAGRILSKNEPGYALRFPRLERFRSDKNPDDITSVDEIKKMFILQTRH
jgi:DNA ligase-1